MRHDYFGYPKDFLFQYQKAIAGVTRADVLRVAKGHFLPENLAIVAVGNPKDFDKPLSTIGKVNTIDLTIPEPKQEVAKSDSASLARGRQLLQRAQQALGGGDKIAAVKDLLQSLEMVMETGGIKVKQNTRYVAPSYFRQDQELPFGKISVYTDGKTGWMATPQGTMPLPTKSFSRLKARFFGTFSRNFGRPGCVSYGECGRSEQGRDRQSQWRTFDDGIRWIDRPAEKRNV